MKPKKRGRNIFEPTARDIRRACEKIQEKWSDQERRKRAGQAQREHWLPPVVDLDSLDSDRNAESNSSHV
jgi:hypothetical protein